MSEPDAARDADRKKALEFLEAIRKLDEGKGGDVIDQDAAVEALLLWVEGVRARGQRAAARSRRASRGADGPGASAGADVG